MTTCYTPRRLFLGQALAWALLAAPAAAAPTLRIPRAATPPTIDAFLTAGERPADGAIADFRQREPGDGVPSSQQTTAFLSYDDERLYVVFVCRDSDPSKIRARLDKRESIAGDDQVGIMLDTFQDHRRSYLFLVNPFGIQADAISTEGVGDVYSYDTLWHSEGRLTPDGFAVLIAIPFKSLRLPQRSTQTWGLALTRIVPRNSEQSFWPAITQRVQGLAPQFATLEGLDGISPGRNIQLIPYNSVAGARVLDRGSATYDDVREYQAGVDAKLVLRDAVTVDVAVRPDFSQIESDQPQVTINQRFEVFFPEKRPFFIENAGFFQYNGIPAVRNVPEFLFFSRRVVNPSLGARMTGKLGRWAFGALAMNDRAATDARVVVGRVQREFGGQSTIGVFTTNRVFAGGSNKVAAIDARLLFRRNWRLTAQAVASATESAGGSRIAGPAYNVNLNFTSRRLLYNAFYSDRSPGFRTQLGFVPRVDIRQIEQYTEHRWRPKSGPVVAVGPNSYFRLNWDHRGQLQEWIVRFPFQMDMKGRTSIFARRIENGETFRGLSFREHVQTINVSTEWLKWLSITESFEGGVVPNFTPAPGVVPALASSLTGSAILVARPSRRIRIEQTYLYSRLRDLTSRSLVFENHILRSTVNYQFSRPLSLRAIVDYSSVVADNRVTTAQPGKQAGLNILATYLLNPGTAIYIGYLDRAENLLLDGIAVVAQGLSPALRRTSSPTTSVGRQVFVKASCLLRF